MLHACGGMPPTYACSSCCAIHHLLYCPQLYKLHLHVQLAVFPLRCSTAMTGCIACSRKPCKGHLQCWISELVHKTRLFEVCNCCLQYTVVHAGFRHMQACKHNRKLPMMLGMAFLHGISTWHFYMAFLHGISMWQFCMASLARLSLSCMVAV